ncbi:MAG TPA: hypothetical protein VFA78_04235 [Chloroflexota bacterium]|nr:hypothetical protein [Chloroflexota bacterium]
MMSIIRSIALSLVASIIATAVANVLFAAPQASEEPGQPKRRRFVGSYVIVVPIVNGNSNNRIGWIREDHYHPLFSLRR